MSLLKKQIQLPWTFNTRSLNITAGALPSAKFHTTKKKNPFPSAHSSLWPFPLWKAEGQMPPWTLRLYVHTVTPDNKCQILFIKRFTLALQSLKQLHKQGCQGFRALTLFPCYRCPRDSAEAPVQHHKIRDITVGIPLISNKWPVITNTHRKNNQKIELE